MSTNHTLMSLCEEYNKIEVPIIQRDYAQGRTEQESVRNGFVDYLVEALSDNRHIELDFVYGNVREDVDRTKPNRILRTFIPIDGQQRITTLWLLHWFLAHKENRMSEISENLKKFVYETRPSAHDFCCKIIEEKLPTCENIDKVIINQAWFDNEWLKDGTVSGMLKMLHTFENYPKLLDGKIKLNQLLSPQNEISFYFVELKEFGLSEELYIRMNARGKILTDFENFKSEFYKIIRNNKRLDEIKDKMEYKWVENLWDYKDNEYLVDNCFMNYLEFITKMLYFKAAKARSEEVYESNFKNLRLLKEIYSSSENVDFLINSFDYIPIIKTLKNTPIFWQGKMVLNLSDLLKNIAEGKDLNIENQLSLYATILYLSNQKVAETDRNDKGISYFIRVVRNLAINTKEKSERDSPRILKSLDDFSKVNDVMAHVNNPQFNLVGFRDSQCKEEHFKSLLLADYKDLIYKAEDCSFFKGHISPLLASCYVDKVEEINQIVQKFTINDSQAKLIDGQKLENIYNAYVKISTDNFNEIWGDLICSDIYTYNYGRLYYEAGFENSGAMLVFAKKFAESKLNTIIDFSISIEKEFVRKLYSQNHDFKTIRNVREQLYLLYIITRRINEQDYDNFFKYNCYNFGWLKKENGYSSIFTDGIDGDPWFENTNPIFQTYGSQFRYNMGLKENHAIDIEIGKDPKYNLFDKLIVWANDECSS